MSEIVIKITPKTVNFGSDKGTNTYTVQVSGKTVGDYTRYNQTDDDIHEILDEVLKGDKEMTDEEKEEFRRERQQEEHEHNEMLSELEPGKGMY